MARSTARRNDRSRGRIEVLPSGSLRVVVFCGRDPLTKRRLYQRELIPAGPTAQAEAEKALRRMVVEIDEERNSRTAATVAQLLERHFALLEIEPKTLITHRSLTDRHVIPLLGKVKVGELRANVFDSFYAELRPLCQPGLRHPPPDNQ